jgi:hypothetical protein
MCVLPVRDLEAFKAMDFCPIECKSHGKEEERIKLRELRTLHLSAKQDGTLCDRKIIF